MARELKEFQDRMCWTNEEMVAQFHWALCVSSAILADFYEKEDQFARTAAEYNDMDWQDFCYGVYMGWI